MQHFLATCCPIWQFWHLVTASRSRKEKAGAEQVLRRGREPFRGGRPTAGDLPPRRGSGGPKENLSDANHMIAVLAFLYSENSDFQDNFGEILRKFNEVYFDIF